MKKVNKKIIIILIILISILAIVFLFNNLSLVQNIQTIIAKRKALEQEDGISYVLYDNQTENKIKTMVIITRQAGIERVEYLDSNEITIIYCDGRTTLAMDIETQINKEYCFNVISNGEEKIESIIIPENYLDEYFTFTSEQEYNVGIEYSNYREGEEITNYYAIGKNSTNWIEYTENINLEISHMDTIGVPNTTVLAKQVDSIGDTIIENKENTYNVPTTGDFDIFANVFASGKTMEHYGFTSSYKYGDERGFEPYNLKVGLGDWSYKTYSATFTLNFSNSNLNLIKAKQLDIEYLLKCSGDWTQRGARVGGSTTLYYTDGTSETQTISQAYYTNVTKKLVFDLDETKQIDYIEMKISGKDAQRICN